VTDEQLARPLVLVIFGITGDLAQRKLLPALYHLQLAGDLPGKLKIVGISRRDVPVHDVYARLKEFSGDEDFNAAVAEQLARHTEMIQMDLVSKQAYADLLEQLEAIEMRLGDDAVRLYYLSIPPQVFTPIIHLLGETGHNAPLAGRNDTPRLLVEKPFGYDEASARELINVVDEHFGESQIYRIDHYVAKETVQNILTFRFNNPLFEAVWNREHINSIRVTAHEQIGIEGRAAFYEQTGALRDLIQSHLLQMLAITTMDRPAKFDSDDIHAEKLKLLQAITPIAPDRVTSQTLRGQYEGYRQEVGNPGSNVETFARIGLAIDNDRWRGVPITLETGKALAHKATEISVCFDGPGQAGSEDNQLVFRLQPKEGITLFLQAKQPGIANVTDTAEMTFDYATSFSVRPAEAYERVIVDAIRGDQTLFASADEVMTSWRIVEHVIKEWAKGPDGLQLYPAGGPGPA
jgi:glucose-6-phosphate 1-dehydrogenase